MKQVVLIALGANLPSEAGPPEQTLADSLTRMSECGFQEVTPSRFYRTPCFPPGAGPDYVNAAATALVEAGANEVLSRLHGIEAEFGRERQQRWGQRSLDLDLIAMGDAVRPDLETFRAWRDLPVDAQRQEAPGQLILPHPRLQDRAFVLVPLMDVAPDWVHPVLGLNVREMVARLDEASVKEVVVL
ncbi:MAG: 2-amino-4-hydroxy-6-hydroxymethyldihydropteridine diphosphokinase [Pseudomonadota bacterium]